MTFASVQVHDVISREVARAMVVRLKNLAAAKYYEDDQVPGAFSAPCAFDDYLVHLLPLMQEALGRDVGPVRSYARIYLPGTVLRPHTDTEDIPYGISLCLSRGPEDWPFKVGEQDYIDRVGSGVLYDGRVKHYRRGKCPGEQAQVFFHYRAKT